MNGKFASDCFRYRGTEWNLGEVIKLMSRDHSLRFLFLFRTLENNPPRLIAFFFRIMLRRMSMKYGLEISKEVKIGRGFYMGHPFNITINPYAILGDNVNIHKGATIGRENRGKRKGAPVIGNCVWIGVNAAIVGSITIGDDVLIAPNAFVNVNVPPHSIVMGNPCTVIENKNATQDYVNRKWVDEAGS